MIKTPQQTAKRALVRRNPIYDRNTLLRLRGSAGDERGRVRKCSRRNDTTGPGRANNVPTVLDGHGHQFGRFNRRNSIKARPSP
jgi:hypothetical protein